jgi:hypothetical protein
MDRSDQIDYVSSQLPPRAALLTRLLVRELSGELPRSEAGLLNTLSGDLGASPSSPSSRGSPSRE